MRSLVSQKVLAAAGTVAVGLALIVLLGGRGQEGPREASRSGVAEAPGITAKDPRLVLGRPWFDRYPKSRTDAVDLWIFFGGGIGIEDKGSSWRSTLDVFELERQGSRLDLVFFQDKSKASVRFEIVACDDKPPFDLCLALKDPLRGQTRLYSWGDDEDMNAHVPWARAWRDSAAARAHAAR